MGVPPFGRAFSCLRRGAADGLLFAFGRVVFFLHESQPFLEIGFLTYPTIKAMMPSVISSSAV
jgi:hypothetical protein